MNEIIGIVLAVIVALGGMFFAGRSSQKSKQKKERLDSIEKSNEIEKQHDQKPIDDVRDNSAKWVRGNKR